MNQHKYDPKFENQYFTLPQLSKIMKIPVGWFTVHLGRAEFSQYRTHKPSRGHGMLLLYNQETVSKINSLRTRRYARGAIINAN